MAKAKTQKIYSLVKDGGDGSASVVFFRDKDLAEKLWDDDENFRANDYVEKYTLPADLDLKKAGFDCQDDYYRNPENRS